MTIHLNIVIFVIGVPLKISSGEKNFQLPFLKKPTDGLNL